MARRDDALSERRAPTARGSPTRRRLLALLGGLPRMALSTASLGAGPRSLGANDPVADPIPRLFTEFQAALERHEAALACCDRIEAALLTQMDYPRVKLPPDWEGSRGYAADALTITENVLPGRHQRRLLRTLQRQQRRWEEAADGAGLTAAQLREAALDGVVLDTADRLLATPAWTLEAVVMKLLVLLGTREPGPGACETSPWRELRLIMMDLSGLAARSGIAS